MEMDAPEESPSENGAMAADSGFAQWWTKNYHEPVPASYADFLQQEVPAKSDGKISILDCSHSLSNDVGWRAVKACTIMKKAEAFLEAMHGIAGFSHFSCTV